jgi:hypothetical protein
VSVLDDLDAKDRRAAMTDRLCPGGGPCPSQRCRFHLPGKACALDFANQGEQTLATIAAAFRCSERTIARDIESALARYEAGLAKLAPDYFSSGTAHGFRLKRRFPDNPMQHRSHASRAAVGSAALLVSGAVQRARRFPRKDIRMIDCTSAPERVAELEQLPAGEAWSALLGEAESAIAADRAAAESTLFPVEIAPTTADAVALYAHHIERIPVVGYGSHLAALHARSVTSYPELAALCRSADALADVGAAAAAHAVPDRLEHHAAAGARAAAEAHRRYQRAIAETLAAAPGHPLGDAARAYLAVQDLIARVAAARARHEQHARAELARVEVERQAAARAIADKTVERVRAAEAAAAEARAAAATTEQELRAARAAALTARLRASGLRSLRVGGNDASFGVDDLIATADRMSAAQIAMYSAALDAVERSR